MLGPTAVRLRSSFTKRKGLPRSSSSAGSPSQCVYTSLHRCTNNAEIKKGDAPCLVLRNKCTVVKETTERTETEAQGQLKIRPKNNTILAFCDPTIASLAIPSALAVNLLTTFCSTPATYSTPSPKRFHHRSLIEP